MPKTTLYKSKQQPFPVVFVRWRGNNKSQVGLMHVERLGDVPVDGDTLLYLDKKQLCVGQRMIRYQPAESNEPAIIDFVEVFVT